MSATALRRPPLLAGKRVFLTGGSRGLGAALCRELAREGARVGFSWARDEAAAQAVVAEIAAAGGQSRAFQASVLDRPANEAALKALESEWGGVDVLVNNAGISQALPLALLEEEDWDKVLDVNLKGAYLVSRAALRGMIRRKAGVILNLGSLAGSRMIDAPLHYCASKGGLKALTQSLAKEVARHGIRVNCLAPGLLEGGVGGNLPEHRLADYLKHCPLGRVGRFEEVARFAAFLVSDRNSYMSGETIVMAGGI